MVDSSNYLISSFGNHNQLLVAGLGNFNCINFPSLYLFALFDHSIASRSNFVEQSVEVLEGARIYIVRFLSFGRAFWIFIR